MPISSPVSAGFAISVGRSISAKQDEPTQSRSSESQRRRSKAGPRVIHYDKRSLKQLQAEFDAKKSA